jgi:hypothetical protein
VCTATFSRDSVNASQPAADAPMPTTTGKDPDWGLTLAFRPPADESRVPGLMLIRFSAAFAAFLLHMDNHIPCLEFFNRPADVDQRLFSRRPLHGHTFAALASANASQILHHDLPAAHESGNRRPRAIGGLPPTGSAIGTTCQLPRSRN